MFAEGSNSRCAAEARRLLPVDDRPPFDLPLPTPLAAAEAAFGGIEAS